MSCCYCVYKIIFYSNNGTIKYVLYHFAKVATTMPIVFKYFQKISLKFSVFLSLYVNEDNSLTAEIPKSKGVRSGDLRGHFSYFATFFNQLAIVNDNNPKQITYNVLVSCI